MLSAVEQELCLKSPVSLRSLGLIFKHPCFFLAIGKCSDHFLSTNQKRKGHRYGDFRSHSLCLCTLNSRVVTSAAQRQGQVTAGETYVAVLVLAGVELIFFIVASMGLCFGFGLETVLITQGCFRYR